jgi:hypothetical protein
LVGKAFAHGEGEDGLSGESGGVSVILEENESAKKAFVEVGAEVVPCEGELFVNFDAVMVFGFDAVLGFVGDNVAGNFDGRVTSSDVSFASGSDGDFAYLESDGGEEDGLLSGSDGDTAGFVSQKRNDEVGGGGDVGEVKKPAAVRDTTLQSAAAAAAVQDDGHERKRFSGERIFDNALDGDGRKRSDGEDEADGKSEYLS